MNDKTTWVTWNLPLNTVVTLMADDKPVPIGSTAADLSHCDECIDLIGTGRTEAVDLREVGMNDKVSSFFWRTVDLKMGAIEVFEHEAFKGNRNIIFLSEWQPATLYNFNHWWLNDKISSLRWQSLLDRQTAVLFDNGDGSGDNLIILKGMEYNRNDKLTSFTWEPLTPVKEVVAPFQITASNPAGSNGLEEVYHGVNNTSLPQPVTVTLNKTEAQQVTTSTTDTFATGISTTITYQSATGIKDVSFTSVTAAVTVSFSYTRTQNITRSDTKTLALTITQTMNAPPMTKFTAKLLVSMGRIPPTEYHTTAERWYNIPVTGSVMDPSNDNLFKRVEPVTVTIEGSLASSTHLVIETTPL
ncbi:hypothetical protein CC78DRAFT_556573 [Lojkania enalia]|uniref:Uncharacterized protein n=1 Tax=Lojkania enalia TaxID=147567 RepID=A0A9P4K197_9PLEO|nr:hypothetical protein CC78DRAFT_556573 [Didymosphaeria enalia]